MTENRQDKDEFEKHLRDSIEGKTTGKAAEESPWDEQDDVYTPAEARNSDSSALPPEPNQAQSEESQEWNRNIGSAVYAVSNQQDPPADNSSAGPPPSPDTKDSAVEDRSVSPEPPAAQTSRPGPQRAHTSWGLRIVAAVAVIALAGWFALREQQGLARLDGLERRLTDLQQQVATAESGAADRERLEGRLDDMETELTESSSPQPPGPSISPAYEALQWQLSERQLQLEALAAAVAALEEDSLAMRKAPAGRSKAKSKSGGNVPAAGKAAGGWVINLITVSRAGYAEQLLAKYRKKGVEAEKVMVKRGGKSLYRLRIGGFPSRAAAEGAVAALRSKLGLKDTWVTRR